GAEPSDRPSRDFDHRRSGRADAELGMDRTVAKPDRSSAPRGSRLDVRERGFRQPRWSDVDRLLEEWPVERIRLIEERERRKRAVSKKSLERDLDPGDVSFDEDFPGPLASPAPNVRL